jgi:phage shock protein E
MTNSQNSELRKQISKSNQKHHFIDVRTPQEFAQSHIEGSTNIPLQSIFMMANSGVEKGDTLVVYCASGMRARQACEILHSLGFSDIVFAGTLSAANALITAQ